MEETGQISSNEIQQKKGKGKENVPRMSQPSTDGQSGNSTSIEQHLLRSSGESTATRLANSAVALAHSLISSPSSVDGLNQILPQGKAGPSAIGSRLSNAETSKIKPQHTLPRVVGDNFQSTHVQRHIENEESAFSAFLDGSPLPTLDGHSSLDEDFLGETNANRILQLPTQNTSRQDYSEADGMEVVRLLDYGYEEVARPEPDIPISKDESLALKEALFGIAPAHVTNAWQTPDWSNILDFFPEYIANGTSGWGYGEIAQHLGVSDVDQAKQIWVDQWQDVLSNYTDVVWGDLGALVDEARDQIQKIQSGNSDDSEAGLSGMKAVRRLQQILAHIRDG
ncbi:hypothetical protein BX600DRAFT_202429 [Xylariales sp. PMI_506]|nr:hypothetical protein BX600DRAFT_202429 [Xylariales sp. PMI_506]